MNTADTGAGLPDVPDTLDEEELMLSLESQANDIEMVIRDMQRFEGVSQKIVNPVRHLIPQNVRFNSYTQNPTHTNLSVTMESMQLKAVALIGAAVAAFAALVAKVIMWLVSLFKRNDNGSSAASKKADELTETLKKNKEIANIMPAEIEREYKVRRDERVNPVYDEMAKVWNPILRDILIAGPVTRTLAGADKTFVDIVKKMKLIVEVIKREGRKDNTGNALAAGQVMATLNDIEIHRDDPSIRNLFVPIYRVPTKEVDYQNDMREIVDHMSSQIAQAYSNSFNGDKVVKDMEGYKVDSYPLRKIEPTDDLESLGKAVESVEKMTFNKNVGVDVDRALRKCLATLRVMMDVVQKFNTMVARCEKMRNDFIDLAHRAASYDNSCMVGAIVSSDDSETKNKLRDLNKKK